jgi:hypothetical protein
VQCSVNRRLGAVWDAGCGGGLLHRVGGRGPLPARPAGGRRSSSSPAQPGRSSLPPFALPPLFCYPNEASAPPDDKIAHPATKAKEDSTRKRYVQDLSRPAAPCCSPLGRRSLTASSRALLHSLLPPPPSRPRRGQTNVNPPPHRRSIQPGSAHPFIQPLISDVLASASPSPTAAVVAQDPTRRRRRRRRPDRHRPPARPVLCLALANRPQAAVDGCGHLH